MELLKLENFPLKAHDKIRYGDTDRQGHINNANFLTFLETGRVELIYNPDLLNPQVNTNFVIASVQLDFLKEMKWPGQVDIGTGIIKIGNSSIKMYQQLFQRDQCVARATTVIVQVDEQTGTSKTLSVNTKTLMQKWVIELSQ
ncbi:MAG: acyl-CoA thioesterase [Bacteroidota bacterium]